MRKALAPHLSQGSPRAADLQARKMRKWRDAAAILTVLGVILFASPLVSAVGSAEASSAVPPSVQYIFDAWAILIAAALLLARLSPSADDTASTLSSEAQNTSPPPANKL